MAVVNNVFYAPNLQVFSPPKKKPTMGRERCVYNFIVAIISQCIHIWHIDMLDNLNMLFLFFKNKWFAKTDHFSSARKVNSRVNGKQQHTLPALNPATAEKLSFLFLSPGILIPVALPVVPEGTRELGKELYSSSLQLLNKTFLLGPSLSSRAKTSASWSCSIPGLILFSLAHAFFPMVLGSTVWKYY